MIPNKGKTGFLPSSESGYTILEGLMAVVVVAVLVSAMGPVIAFSVGTRVQAKRVELATQAAKSYIDWVKSPPAANETGTRHPTQTAKTAPSTGDLAGTCTTADGYCNPTDKKLYCVNFDENAGCQTSSLVDMVVQPIITSVKDNNANNVNLGYQMQVAVYRANSFSSGITLQPATKSDSLTTNALGNRSLPLVVMKTEVFPQDATYDNLKERINGGSAPTP